MPAARAEGWKNSVLAVLCPCGETTSKESRASHCWASPQMLFERVPAPANCHSGFCAVSMGFFVLCLLVIEIRETCGLWFYKKIKEEVCLLRYHCMSL